MEAMDDELKKYAIFYSGGFSWLSNHWLRNNTKVIRKPGKVSIEYIYMENLYYWTVMLSKNF